MKQFHTAVLERKKSFAGSFAVQPYEAGWAEEAVFFVRLESCEHHAVQVRARVQISVDGVRWVDEGTAFATISEGTDAFVRVRHFGGWLRIIGETVDGAAVLTVHLVLKG